MLTILLHSSKTMTAADPASAAGVYNAPQLLDQASQLAGYIKDLSADDLATSMKLSPTLAAKTYQLWQSWTTDPKRTSPAIDSFLGDIYSGLQVASMTPHDREFAHHHLIILSGLYGGLRALDSISPYRLEMGYRLPDPAYANLYQYWGDQIAQLVPAGDTIINLSAVEYTKAVLPHLPSDTKVITPKFLTMDHSGGSAKFVTVHAKIARGGFARWLIDQRIDQPDDVSGFDQLGYAYQPDLSQDGTPVLVCQEFGGLGLSIRLGSSERRAEQSDG